MSVANLVRSLAKRGVQLSNNEGQLRVDAPSAAVTQELRDLLTQHKKEILALLVAERGLSKAPGPLFWGSKFSLDQLLSLTFDEFVKAEIAVEIYSKILEEKIILASTEVVKSQLDQIGFIIYLPEEIIELEGVSPSFLIQIHAVKKTFDGVVQSAGGENG